MPAKDISLFQDIAPRFVTHHNIAVREDTLFANQKGQEKKGVRKRALKALEQIQEPLAKVLEQDEVVISIARGQSPVGILEQLTMGWMIALVTAAYLVVTNRRVVQFHIESSGKWKGSLRAVRWSDVVHVKVPGLFRPSVQLTYRDGRREKFWGFHGEAKKLRVLAPILLAAGTGEATQAEGMVSLCPSCAAALTPGVYQCGACGQTFKDEKSMVRRSWLIPGGGYFYTKNWFLGLGDFIFEAILFVFVAEMLLVAAGVAVDPDFKGENGRGGAIVAAVFLGVILVVEKFITIHHCRRFIREYIPINQ